MDQSITRLLRSPAAIRALSYQWQTPYLSPNSTFSTRRSTRNVQTWSLVSLIASSLWETSKRTLAIRSLVVQRLPSHQWHFPRSILRSRRILVIPASCIQLLSYRRLLTPFPHAIPIWIIMTAPVPEAIARTMLLLINWRSISCSNGIQVFRQT